MSVQFHRVSDAFGMNTFSSVMPDDLRKFFGACMIPFENDMSSVYHTPALAISKNVHPVSLTFLQYQSGYFHWNKLSVISRSALSFSGDSPSAKVQRLTIRSCEENKARSPVRILSDIIFVPLIRLLPHYSSVIFRSDVFVDRFCRYLARTHCTYNGRCARNGVTARIDAFAG